MRLCSFVFLAALACAGQVPAGSAEITVPAGKVVTLQTLSPLSTKALDPGDSLRAVITFPVVVAGQVAIPPGVYVDGTVDTVTRRGRRAGFTAHFTRMIFPNGYTVPLAATGHLRADQLGAKAEPPLPGNGSATAMSAFPVQPPTPVLTPPSPPASHTGLLVGLAVAGAAASVLVAVLMSRTGGYLYLDAGWKMDMVLGSPLVLDGSRTAAAPGT